MFRRAFRHLLLVAAITATVATPALPQSGSSLADRLDAAEKKLAEDSKACKPINVRDYAELLDEAVRNKTRAEKMKKSGVPVDQAQLDRDWNRASRLILEADRAAADQKCPRRQPKIAAPTATPKAEATTTTESPSSNLTNGLLGRPLLTGDPLLRLEFEADETLDELDDALDDCDVDRIKALLPKLDALEKRARKMAEDARATGAYSNVDAKEADALASELHDAAFEASMTGALIQQCRDKLRKPVSQPQMPRAPQPGGSKPRQSDKPVPPRHSVVDDLFPKAPPVPEKKTTSMLPPFAREILAAHNMARQEAGAAPLLWNDTLAAHATTYAQSLAATGQLVHAPREGRVIERENLSEGNLWWTTGQMMTNWMAEKRNFVPGLFPNVTRTGNWMDVAHYTQMIWPTTTDVGCGEATGSGHKWLVCRYSPGGNKDGKPVGLPVNR